MQQRQSLIHGILDASLPIENPKIIHEAMRYSLLNGGKKICPIVCLAVYEIIGGKSMEQILPTACAHEMIHAMTLIHDDLPAMDNDQFRRGKLSCWKKFGEDMAILAGDALIAFAIEYIARETKTVDPSIILKVLVEFTQSLGAKGVAGGQVMDIQMTAKQCDLKVLQYIHKHKSAKLLESAAVCGVILAGGTEEDILTMRTYAVNVGLAYQIVDDILDVTQTSKHLGKTAAKDIEQNKTTYPKLLGIKQSKKIVEELISDAKAQIFLKYKLSEAQPLFSIADYVLARNK